MLQFSIILVSWLVWCVNGRPLPCTMIDDKEGKGAMLCCDYQPVPHEKGLTGIKAQSNQVLHSNKKCTLMTPKTSLGLMKEVWSLRNYTWAAGMLKTKLPNTNDIPRDKGCCCEEQFVFSITNEGISALTGKTHKIVQQDQYVQPVLSLLCVRSDNCHISGNMKVFQRMEAHSYYVESEDHPEYVHEELLLKPSGCLCVPDTQTVKADTGEILIPMNLIEEAMAESRIIKRNVEYHTELPEILRLALEIMREPNPLPVLDSIERQMALQLQQTRYFTAMAMAAGLGGSEFEPDYKNIYQQSHQGNETKTDMESSKEFPHHSYQLILSAFLSGLALGQSFINISQVEILDRLIVDNGNSGINLLETILQLQNHSLALDYNSLEFDLNSINITNIDSQGTHSNKTKLHDSTSPIYVTTASNLPSSTYVTRTSDISSPTYNTKTSDLSSTDVIDSDSSSQAYVPSSDLSSTTIYTSLSIFSNTTHVTSTATVVDTTEETVIHTSSHGIVTTSTSAAMAETSTETSIGISSEGVDATLSAVLADSTTDSALRDETSSQNGDFVNNNSIIDSSSESSIYSSYFEEYTTSESIAGASMIFNEEMTSKAAALVGSTDNIADTVFYTSSDKEYTIPVADSHVYFDENNSTNAPAVFDGATKHDSSNEDYSTHAATPMNDNFEGGFTSPDEDSKTHVPVLTDEVQHGSSKDYTTDATAMVDSTTGPIGQTSFNEDYTTDAGNVDGRTEVYDNIVYNEDDVTSAETIVGSTAEPYFQTSYNQEHSTNTAEFIVSSTKPTNTFYSEDNAASSTQDDSTTESVQTSYNEADTTIEIKEHDFTTSNDEYVATSNISEDSEIPESTFNLHDYIMGLPQFQPLTIDTELLMHIMFPPDPITHDERDAGALINHNKIHFGSLISHDERAAGSH